MRRARRAGLLAGAGLVVLTAAAAVVLWRDAGAAESALAEARLAMQAGEHALSDEHDAATAAEAFGDARGLASEAQARLDGPLWPLVRLVPRMGGSVDVARSAADLAGATARLGIEATEHADALLEGEALRGLLADGRIDLARLDELAGIVGDLPVEPVRHARDRLAGVPTGQVRPSLLDDRRAALAQVDELLARLHRIDRGLAAARTFLGADGDRAYLIAAQNPAELRGTGGLIGFLTELRIRDGRIEMTAGQSVDAEDELIRRTSLDAMSDLPDPVDRPAAFADRYDHIAAGSFFASVNADPDLPTVGPVLADLYEQEVGGEVDGVVLVDPVALGGIVAATGEPLVLPDELDTAGLPREIPGSQVASLVMVDGYDAFGGGGEAKKAFDRAVITAGFGRLMSGGWEPVSMAQTLGDQFATRHLQVWSRDEAEQATFELLDLAGQMTPTQERVGDVLAVTGNNAGPNKMDVHVSHRISGEFELGSVRDTAPGRVLRTGALRVEVENPLRPADHDPYVTASLELPQPEGPSQFVDMALNRTWFSVWTLPTTEAPQLREGGEATMFRATTIHGHRVFDHYLETPSASTNSFEIDLEGWVELERDGDAMTYELELWRQAKAIPDHWDLTIAPPPGWTVAEATVEGGGAPTGMGLGGDDGQPVTASVQDGGVRLVGAVTRDASVSVVLRRS